MLPTVCYLGAMRHLASLGKAFAKLPFFVPVRAGKTAHTLVPTTTIVPQRGTSSDPMDTAARLQEE